MGLRLSRILIVLAGVMGADGVILAAAAAHQPDAARLASASSMLLFHAARAARRGGAGRARRHPCRDRDLAAACGFVVATALFAGDLTLRHYAGHGLFPMAAPTGGTLLIASWLLLAVAAAWPRRRRETVARTSHALRPARQSDKNPPSPNLTRPCFMTDAPHISPLDQARILSEALPHMQQYDEETIVIKYGGHAMGAEDTAKAFARDIVLLEQTAINPVVVHGGGPQIATMLKRLGIQSEFAAGLRITDAATIEIVEMVLAGSINKQLVGYINEAGGKAVGLCGKDGNMVMASKATRTMVDPDSNIERVVDLGFVGEPDKVDLTLLNQLIGHELIPVLAPLATSATGQTFNVNADTFAGAVAGALKAKRLLLLTDVPGVLDKSKKLIPELSVKDARKLIADGTISGGMIPKVETCIYALEQGVEGVVIIDGKTQHAVLLELFTNQGTGTLIHK